MRKLAITGILLIGLSSLSFAVETVDITSPQVKQWEALPPDHSPSGLVQEYTIPNGPGMGLIIQSVPRDKNRTIANSQEALLQRVRQDYTNYLFNILKKTENELIVEIKGIGDPVKQNSYTLEKVLLGPKGFHAISYTAADTAQREEMIAVIGNTKIINKKLPPPITTLTEASVKQLVTNFSLGLKTQKAEKLAVLLSPDAIIATKGLSVGKDEFLQLFKAGAAKLERYDNKLEIKSVKIDKDKATAEFELTENGNIKGVGPLNVKTMNTLNFERQKNKILITRYTVKKRRVSLEQILWQEHNDSSTSGVRTGNTTCRCRANSPSSTNKSAPKLSSGHTV